MRSIWKELFTAAFLGMILPGVVLNVLVMIQDMKPETAVQEQHQLQPIQEQLSILVTGEDGSVQEHAMDDYLTGVVLAEMPASFEEEALKAQAVAARTYAQKASVTGGKHGNGSICTDPSCCQAYLSEEAYLDKGGTAESVDKVRQAVADTSGLVLTYEGELIEATYFSCSGGYTEDAMAVWGADYPYLQAVSSPGEEEAAHYLTTVHFTPGQFLLALGCVVEGSPENWFGPVTYTEGGGVATMEIGGVSYTGTQLRRLLGLRSTAFSVSVDGEGITITTKGYGHRVGMSQYGADAMAVDGSTCQEILAHYYPGTQLQIIEP